MASNYTYDALYELTQVTQGANTTESYSYDPVGNRLSSFRVSPYSYNNSNELTATPNVIYTYDYNGNTLTKTDTNGTTAFAWNFENRLTSVTLPKNAGTVSFKYDPFGKRIYKASSSGNSIYAYSDENVVQESDSNGAVTARYAADLDVDQPLAVMRSGVMSYYDPDALGSTTSLSDVSGIVAQIYSYDSFGKQITSSGSLANPLECTAGEFDPETSLYYYRARYYDPVIGRFVSEDPARSQGGINFYSYVTNSPINLIDPFGFCPWQIHRRPLNGVPGAGSLGLDHYYFYNTQTGQSLGLGPLGGFASPVIVGRPVPGIWERREKPGRNVGPVPEWGCGCVDKKVKNPGNPPNFCTYNGNAKPNHVNPHPTCPNCIGWVMSVLQDCYNQASGGQK